MLAPSSQHEAFAALRQRLLRWSSIDRPSFSIGLDRIFPTGFRRGTLAEFLGDCGNGASALALIAAREACQNGDALVIVEPKQRFYPPAAWNFGISSSTIVVHPRTRKDELWAMHQALSCPGVGAVLCWPEKLDQRAFRCLQLAAEIGSAIGLWVRPAGVRGHPTWSDVQLLVEALPRRSAKRILRVEVVRCRIGNAGASMEVELDDETGTLQESRDVRLATELASATTARRPSGA